MIWVLEIVILLLFVGFGGFPGFIAWAVLTALVLFGRYASQQTKLKAAEVMLRAERNAMDQGADARPPRLIAGSADTDRDAQRGHGSSIPTTSRDLPASRQCPSCGAFSRRTPCKCGYDLSQPPPGAATRTDATQPKADGSGARVCGTCHAPNDEDAIFCNGCGASLVVERVCDCGTSNAGGARFCKKCGRSLEIGAQAPTATPNKPSRRSRPSADVVRLRTCEECGTKNRGDAYKCSCCGSLFL
jgi:Double zinc ribbon